MSLLKFGIFLLICFVLSVLLLLNSTGQFHADYIHKETLKLRYHAIGSTSEVDLKKPVVLVPNFRRLAWDKPMYPSLYVLSDEPVEVYIKSATLKGRNGKHETFREIDRLVPLEIRQRLATREERVTTGRLIDTNHYIGKQWLRFKPIKFNSLRTLYLEVVASIGGGPLQTYSFKLVYKKRLMSGMIKR